MRDEAIIALLLVLVVVSAGAGYFVGTSGGKTTTTTSVSSATTTSTSTYAMTSTILSMVTETHSVLAGTGCSTPVNQPPVGTNDTNLFYLSEPSEATICVTYEYQGGDNATFGYPALGYVKNDTATSCMLSCWGIKVSASPTFVQYNGLTNITVTYRVSTSAGLEKGIYWLIGLGSCSPVALVYGQNYTKIDLGSIGGEARGCSFGYPITYWVVGVSNMTVSAVPTYE